jgi:hypothetical protein
LTIGVFHQTSFPNRIDPIGILNDSVGGDQRQRRWRTIATMALKRNYETLLTSWTNLESKTFRPRRTQDDQAVTTCSFTSSGRLQAGELFAAFFFSVSAKASLANA